MRTVIVFCTLICPRGTSCRELLNAVAGLVQAFCLTNQDVARNQKSGQCPRFPPGSLGICVSNCRLDGDCQGARKCCRNPCGFNVCLNPAQPDNSNNNNILLPQRPSCAYVRCGTGQTCVLRLVLCFRGPCYPQPVCVRLPGSNQDVARNQKSGQCPRFPPGSLGICVSNCRLDGDCQGARKCCRNPCGFNVCLNPAQPDNNNNNNILLPQRPSCSTLQCGQGQTCVLQRVLCFRYPCHPQPVCVVSPRSG